MSLISRTLRVVCCTAVIAAVTVSVLAAPASATTTICSGGGSFTIVGGPAVDAFSGQTCKGTATIASTVKTILGDAFRARTGVRSAVDLTSVEFEAPSSLEYIGTNAFEGSGLTSIVIPNSVKIIWSAAFASASSLETVSFEAGSKLTDIRGGAFSDTNLRTISIPSSVTFIAPNAFSGARRLASVAFEGDAPTVRPGAFTNVAAGATANIGRTAAGFVLDDGGLWNGLVLVRAGDPSGPEADAPVPSALQLTCTPHAPVAGGMVTCTVTGGDAGIDILWRAAYNPTFAEAGVTLDASGAGTFSFVVPAATLGQSITVELVDWAAPVSLGVSSGPVPTSVPSGEGPVPVWPLGLLALAGVLVLRSGSRSPRLMPSMREG